MRPTVWLKYFLGWLPMVAIAIANGALRQAVLQQRLGELRAHQVSTASGIVFFGIYIWWLMRRWRPGTTRETMVIGAAWLALTVLFEFGMGRSLGREWSTLLADYNLMAGRVWPLILIWVAIAPTLLAPRRAETPRGSAP
jgi:hypothetical protein